MSKNIIVGKGSYLANGYEILSYSCFTETGEEACVKIGNFSSIAENCTFILSRHYNYITTSTLLNYRDQSKTLNPCQKGNKTGYSKGNIIIENDVWICANTTILDNITISNGTIVGAGSVVTKDTFPYSIVAGNPARLIRFRFSEKQIENLLKTKWWHWPDEKIKKFAYLLQSDQIDKFIEVSNGTHV